MGLDQKQGQNPIVHCRFVGFPPLLGAKNASKSLKMPMFPYKMDTLYTLGLMFQPRCIVTNWRTLDFRYSAPGSRLGVAEKKVLTWLNVATSMYALLNRKRSTEHPTVTQSWPNWLYSLDCGVRTAFSLSEPNTLRSSRLFSLPGASAIGRLWWKIISLPVQSAAYSVNNRKNINKIYFIDLT